MSGLSLRSHMERWPRWFPRQEFQTLGRPYRPSHAAECLVPWIARSHHLLTVLQVLASAQYGCSSVAPRDWL